MAGFGDIIGQEQIKEHLQKAVKQSRISHAYIIQGERACGKEFVARIFAQALLCEKEGAEPCGVCRSCKQVMSGTHPDLITVTHEKPNVIGVDDVRNQIVEPLSIKPYSGPYKIFIMNEGEKMNVQAQNALLKSLEEPPIYAVIMILTTGVDTLLPTIQSRCVLLNMKPVKDELVKDYLMKELQIPDYKADICVAFARGNIGQARLLAGSEDFENIVREALSLVKNIRSMTLPEVMTAVRKLHDYNMDAENYIDVLSIWYRDVLMFKATSDSNHLVFRDEVQHIRKAADMSDYEGIETILDALEKAKKRMRANVNFEMVMELLFITIQEN